MARKPVGETSRAEPSPRRGAEPPLWSIAAAAGVIIFTPMLLYSIAPEGPIREGDPWYRASFPPFARPHQNQRAPIRNKLHYRW